MKYLLIIILAATTSFAKTIKDGDTEYQCNPVKTCDEKLKSAYAEIARLKKQVKQISKVTNIETVEKIVVKTKEITKIKKHIVSVLGHKSVINVETKVLTSGSNQVAEGKIETAYIPSLVYQYQFDSGLVPLIGVDITRGSGLLFGLGYEF